MRLAIATSTGPADWGLDIDWDVLATFQLELEMQAEAIERRSQVVGRG